MKGQILEYNNGKGYKRGIVCFPQIKSLIKQKRVLVYLVDDDFNLLKNEKGGNIGSIFDLDKSRTIGYID